MQKHQAMVQVQLAHKDWQETMVQQVQLDSNDWQETTV
jgi:hypothetical protein